MRKVSKIIRNAPFVFSNKFQALVTSTITISAQDITVGDNAIITVITPSNATGNVEVIIGDEYYSKKVIATPGTVSFTASGLTVGLKTVIANYLGDSSYRSCNNTTSFIVDIPRTDIGDSTLSILVPTDNTTYKSGDIIHPSSIKVVNTCEHTIENLEIECELINETWNIASLAPNEAYFITNFEYVVNESDIVQNNGLIEAIFSVTGEINNTEQLEYISENYYCDYNIATSNPSLAMTLAYDDDTVYYYDDVAYPSATIINNGNITYYNVEVESEILGETWQIGTLAPGDRYTINSEYTLDDYAYSNGYSCDFILSGEDYLGSSREIRDQLSYTVLGLTMDASDGSDKTYRVGENIRECLYITNLSSHEILFTINSVTVNGNNASVISEVPATLTAGESVELNVDYVITGNEGDNTLTFNASVSGTYDDVTLTVTASDTVDVTPRYRLTINYWIGNTPAADSFTNIYDSGSTYDVRSPLMVGYTADQGRVTGTITNNTVINVYYTCDTYGLTINYIYLDGTTAAPSYYGEHAYGSNVRVVSPTLTNGYVPSEDVYETTMPARDVTYTITYSRSMEDYN